MSNTASDRINGEILREWRISQNFDISELAISASLSIAQIQQLESGGSSLFYTVSIKENAARKVAYLLGGHPDSVICLDGGQFESKDSSILDELVDLSREKTQRGFDLQLLIRYVVSTVLLLALFAGVVASFGWFEKKWQSGGSEQFWRESVKSSKRESVSWTTPGYSAPHPLLTGKLEAIASKATPQ